MNFEMSSAKMASSTLSNHMHYKVWDQITYPFTNSKGCTIKVWEWISNSPPYFIGCMISYSSWDLS